MNAGFKSMVGILYSSLGFGKVLNSAFLVHHSLIWGKFINHTLDDKIVPTKINLMHLNF